MTDASSEVVERVPTKCHGCGATDVAPKIQTWGMWEQKIDEDTFKRIDSPDFHFDCLPAEYEELLGVDQPQHASTVATIAAAREGLRGQELLDFIDAQPDDNDVDHDEILRAGGIATSQEN